MKVRTKEVRLDTVFLSKIY